MTCKIRHDKMYISIDIFSLVEDLGFPSPITSLAGG